MKQFYKFAAIALLFFVSAGLFGQGYVKGVIKDADTKEGLVGATVFVKGTTTGTTTDVSGLFILKVDEGTSTIVVQFVGYKAQEFEATVSQGETRNLGNIFLESTSFGLTGIQVIADRAQERETPVALSNLDKKEIEQVLGSRDIPMAMNITPNVYATMQGGGAGDARINVRGFNQRNVAIMINGVPVNDMENGWVYWSNWDGVGDATSSIQIQRGLSAVNLATPSIGGTMNVITNPAEQKAGFSYKQEFGTGRFMKSTIFGHSGLIDGKYAFSGGVVRKTGDGIIDGTWTDAWAYFFGASWNINSTNRIELYAIGAPQRHGQNLYKQNIAAYSHEYAKSLDDYDEAALDAFPEDPAGRYYNENWGTVDEKYDGQQEWNGKLHDRYDKKLLNERENYYHKPLVNLNWYSMFSEKVSLFTTAYYSGGKGGGTGTYGSMRWDYRGPSRVVDWDATIDRNMETDTARGILRNSINNQWTIGILSKLKWRVSDRLSFSLGIDGRTAEIEHYRTVRDLLGGQFFIYDGNDFDMEDQYRKVRGDKIAYNFTNTVNWIGGYAQGEYKTEKLTAYAMAGFSGIKYGYTNHFTMTDAGTELTAETDFITGYQAKGGANYNLTEQINIYANLGYVSKVPIFDAVINDRDASVAESPENEKFTSFEVGGQAASANRKFVANLNFYYTTWMDRTRNIGIVLEDGSEGFVFIQGMDQRHLGFELEGKWIPTSWLEILFAGSINNWTYTSDVTGVYKDYEGGGEEEVEYNYYVRDLKVGDAPQTQGILGITVYPVKQWRFQILLRNYMDHYADWDPFSRTDPDDRMQVWKAPAFTVVDLHTSYDIPLDGDLQLQLFGHVFNVFDNVYVQDAVDNSRYNSYSNDEGIVNPHSADAAEVFLGLPFHFNVGVQLRY